MVTVLTDRSCNWLYLLGCRRAWQDRAFGVASPGLGPQCTGADSLWAACGRCVGLPLIVGSSHFLSFQRYVDCRPPWWHWWVAVVTGRGGVPILERILFFLSGSGCSTRVSKNNPRPPVASSYQSLIDPAETGSEIPPKWLRRSTSRTTM